MNKYIVVLISLAFLGTGCKKKYEEGFAAGEIAGVKDGRVAGTSEGYANGKVDGQDIAYDNGYAVGNAAGTTDGYNEAEAYYTAAGYNEGTVDGAAVGIGHGRTDGYEDGYAGAYDSTYNSSYNTGVIVGGNYGRGDGSTDGYADGEADGYDDSYDSAYDSYYSSGESDGIAIGSTDDFEFDTGYDNGYDAGYDFSYDTGYDNGYDDASMGLSTKSNNPVVQLALMVNKDLIDYKGLETFSSQAASVNLGMSASVDASVDMEKLAALKEQHYLSQMATQLESKFGLSAVRSNELATVVHQFNKLAGTRELTDADANAFAAEIVGKSLKDVDFAVRESMKGNSGLLNTMIDEIAVHNQTSSEKVNAMISQIFF